MLLTTASIDDFIGMCMWLANSINNPVYLECSRVFQNEHTSHVIVKYVLETNMPTKLGIYANYLIDIYRRLYTCATYEVIAITMWQWPLHTYLTYITNKYGCHIAHICTTALLLYCTHRSHIITHTQLKHLVCDTNSNKVMDINVKINMATKGKLITAINNK